MPTPERGAIGREEARRRGERAQRPPEGAGRLSAEEARRVMDERARTLARAPSSAGPAAGAFDVVVFTLGSERYGIEPRWVREILRVTDLSAVPGVPEPFRGVVNLRGDVLAVVDLRRLLDLPPMGLTDLARIVVLGKERAEFGVLADAVLEIATVAPGDLRDPPPTVTGPGRACLRGVTGEALVVLDGEALLDDPRLLVDQGAERSP